MIKNITHATLAFLVLLLFGCGNQKQETETTSTNDSELNLSKNSMKNDPVFEIAVRKVKAGQLDAFKEARAKFISELKKQDGANVDREFMSFYALPEPDDTEVFIGMTEWASMEAAGAASQNLMAQPVANEFFSTLDFKAYVMVKPIEGPAFNLETLAAKDGQVLEVAVRKVNEGMEAEFQDSRKAFVQLLDGMEGVVGGSYEFEVVSETEGLVTVGMTVYENQEVFQNISGQLMSNEITQKYFSTFVPVAAQYAVSTTNQ